MAPDADRYESWYAESLWALLPEIYRASDSADFDVKGPLHELVERIGVQMAIVRRSIDRMWDDQSIETCDDWVVPYIGDLVAAKPVASLDARGQRLQVAKAIYYRRRAGTVAILEEAARDVTGWETFVVEFFRRLGRTRHNFDPPIGRPADERDPTGAARLQLAQKLVGRASGTPAGGWADLRDAYGSERAHTAFDEYAHTADFRRGAGRTGWHNIPRLGIFVWRLHSFPESAEDPDGLLTTPVFSGNAKCDTYYTFDPTGREVPLFAALSRDETSYGARWISPDEWQLPGRIDRRLLVHDRARLYSHVTSGNLVPASLGVFRVNVNDLVPFTKSDLEIDPERGRLHVLSALPNDHVNLRVFYHHGSAGRIGAGAYDRRLVTKELAPKLGVETFVTGGGNKLQTALNALGATGTITIDDSLTYNALTDVGPLDAVTIRCDNGKRALIRPAAGTTWTLTGNVNALLHLEGLFVSGADLVLAGDFEHVSIAFSTLDPGSEDVTGSALFAKSIDGRELAPSRIWIEGKVGTLHIRSSIAGPIRTRNNGQLEHLVIEESIVQGLQSTLIDGSISPLDAYDFLSFVLRLQARKEAVSKRVVSLLSKATVDLIEAFKGKITKKLQLAIVTDLNAQFPVADFTGGDLASIPPGPERARRNHAFLVNAFPIAWRDAALAIPTGDVRIIRSTILGYATLHRVDVSESILHDLVDTEDEQHGCVRFSAWTRGSVLPRKYASAAIPPRAEIFTSAVFGNPAYGQLRRDADREVLPPPPTSVTPRRSIREGAENGSEMGAFYAEMNAVRERSLQLKLRELMPLGLIPVLVPVT